MKLNAKFTIKPVADRYKTPFLAKKVVDNDGALLCFLRNGKLYDLNGEYFAPCIKLFDEEDDVPADQFVTDGKLLIRNNVIEGQINRDSEFRLFVIFLAFLLCVTSTALVVVSKDYFDPVIPEFTVVDVDGVWNANGKINVFGNQTIKPGDRGIYSFMVNNPCRSDLECKIKFIISYDGTPTPPINYSLTSEGQTLITTHSQSEFEVSNIIIRKKDSRAFYLEWSWIFDGNDELDTQLGTLGKDYKIRIEIFAEEA